MSDKNQIIRISNGRFTACIRPEGAQIVSLIAPDGREVIWQGDPAIWADHTPVLFPVIGNCKDASVTIGGKTYPMAKHGFARKAMFTPIIVGKNYVTLELTESPATLKMYPFAFSLQVTYELTDNGFVCTFAVENQSDKPMPFCVGGHPAFVVPMEDGAAFEDYQVVFPEDEQFTNLLCPGGQLITGSEPLSAPGGVIPLTHAIFDEKDTLMLQGLKSRHVDLVHRKSGHGLRLTCPDMDVLAIWTRPHNHGNYLCLEPWVGQPGGVAESGAFADKPFALTLQPGETYPFFFEAELI